ncbi:MAG: glycoside hydrolase [Candidatus Niameybacter stercoravium]|nr:glycoside hydrolase [Candidatus Niameybacter stercoravium]
MASQITLDSTVVFEPLKDFNSKYFRIPFLTSTPKGALIAGSDVRYTDGSDYNQIDIGIARSEDGGKTWIDKQIVFKNNGIHEHSRKMDGCIVVDQVTGRIFLFALSLDLHMHLDSTDNKHQSFVYKYSDDDGLTWSEEISLRHFYDDDCILFFQGPGNGIQLQNGTLIIPIQRWVPVPHRDRSQAGIIYSKDHGLTWERCETLIDTYTSESAVVEYKPNEILISCRSPLTEARGFYVTNDLGETWTPHISHDTLLEFGGCQSAFLKITAPNQKTYALHTAPQQTHSPWERNKLTLMCSDDYTHWNYVAEIIHTPNDGYTCMTYDEKKHELYLLGEQKGSIVFYNLTCFLPLIMQNTRSYDHQALSTIHQYPVYSQGHHHAISHPDNWYKVLDVNIKKEGFLLLNLNLLSFNHNELVTLKMKQSDVEQHDLANCHLTHTSLEQSTGGATLALVPTGQGADTFHYELYYTQSSIDTLSVSVVNCLAANHNKTSFRLATSFQDPNLEKYVTALPECSSDLQPILLNL